MSRAPVPSADVVVISGSTLDALQLKLAGDPDLELEAVEGSPDMVVVRAAGEGPQPKATWARVQRAVGEDTVVAPVLTDEQGHTLFPTGTLQIRFDRAPSDTELERFAQAHGLKLLHRNKFQLAQASFAIRDPLHNYLPDLVSTLEGELGVRRAWPETKSRYERT